MEVLCAPWEQSDIDELVPQLLFKGYRRVQLDTSWLAEVWEVDTQNYLWCDPQWRVSKLEVIWKDVQPPEFQSWFETTSSCFCYLGSELVASRYTKQSTPNVGACWSRWTWNLISSIQWLWFVFLQLNGSSESKLNSFPKASRSNFQVQAKVLFVDLFVPCVEKFSVKAVARWLGRDVGNTKNPAFEVFLKSSDVVAGRKVFAMSIRKKEKKVDAQYSSCLPQGWHLQGLPTSPVCW